MTMMRQRDAELQPVRDELAECVGKAERLQERIDELEQDREMILRLLGSTRLREDSLEREVGDLRKLLWGPK